MSKIKVADFYYGAALSVLFNNSNKKIRAAIIESDENRQLYDLMTNNTCRLFIKYRSRKQDTKTEDYSSWMFSLTTRDLNELRSIIDNGHNLVVALVCADTELSASELALIDKEQVNELINLGKDSITISRIKGEHAYRISIGGGRENAMLVTANRFDELF
jgi:hypothetical protein